MYQAFEEDVMDDLFYEAVEGPSALGFEDEFDEYDLAADAFDEFEDEFDALADYAADEDVYEEDVYDAFEEVVVDALEEEDTDEFLSQLLGGLSGIAQQVAPVVGQALSSMGQVGGAPPRSGRRATPRPRGRARRAPGPTPGRPSRRPTGQMRSPRSAGTRLRGAARRGAGAARRAGAAAAPMIGAGLRQLGQYAAQQAQQAQQGPLSIGGFSLSPEMLQNLGNLGSSLGNLIGFDDLDALDELIDFAELEDAVDEAAPALAGLMLRRAIPNVARLPRPARQQLVRTASQGVRTLARRQGPQAARAMLPIVQSARRTVQQQRLPVRAVAPAIQRRTAQVARSPQMVRRLATQSRRIPPRPTMIRRPGVPMTLPLRRVRRPGMPTAARGPRPRGMRAPAIPPTRVIRRVQRPVIGAPQTTVIEEYGTPGAPTPSLVQRPTMATAAGGTPVCPSCGAPYQCYGCQPIHDTL